MTRRLPAIIVAISACVLVARAQQVPDRTFQPQLQQPAYAEGKGPTVCLDEAHDNFHTLDNRFWAFGDLLRRDGFAIQPSRAKFDAGSLARCTILVISNAQPGSAPWDALPSPTPSAFTKPEVAAVHLWVRQGGKLLLIADHMPLAGAAATLAAVFGVTFVDGFAVERFSDSSGRDAAFATPTIFRVSDRTLQPHDIVRGRNAAESVQTVRTFTGQAFRAPPGAELLLVLPSSFVSLMPEKAWQFTDQTRQLPVGGWLQGAVMRVGSGRAAFFGEAAMFSAQLGGPKQQPMGMNAPGAEQNFQFVLNVLHWLAGIL